MLKIYRNVYAKGRHFKSCFHQIFPKPNSPKSKFSRPGYPLKCYNLIVCPLFSSQNLKLQWNIRGSWKCNLWAMTGLANVRGHFSAIFSQNVLQGHKVHHIGEAAGSGHHKWVNEGWTFSYLGPACHPSALQTLGLRRRRLTFENAHNPEWQ